MFSTNQNKGFAMKFDNGWLVSVQFGYGNYCDNRDNRKCRGGKDDCRSTSAEIAAWHGDTWLDFGTDQVKGWCNADDVAEFMFYVSGLPELGVEYDTRKKYRPLDGDRSRVAVLR